MRGAHQRETDVGRQVEPTHTNTHAAKIFSWNRTSTTMVCATMVWACISVFFLCFPSSCSVLFLFLSVFVMFSPSLFKRLQVMLRAVRLQNGCTAGIHWKRWTSDRHDFREHRQRFWEFGPSLWASVKHWARSVLHVACTLKPSYECT